jgi:hypothetical protein
MLNRIAAPPSILPLGLCALVCLKVLVSGGSQAIALPRGEAGPTPGFLLIQNGPPSADQQAHEDRPALFADLEEVMRGTRVTLEELTEATARVAELTKTIEAAHRESTRLDQALVTPR